MTPKKPSQRDILRQLFLDNPRVPIPLPRILGLFISQYGTRIRELRKKDEMNIKNDGEWVNGVHHTWFTYFPKPQGTQLELSGMDKLKPKKYEYD